MYSYRFLVMLAPQMLNRPMFNFIFLGSQGEYTNELIRDCVDAMLRHIAGDNDIPMLRK